jgi:putative membrane protein
MFKPAALATSIVLALTLSASARTAAQGPTRPPSIPQPQPEPPRTPPTPLSPKAPPEPSPGTATGVPSTSAVFDKLKPAPSSEVFLKKAAQVDEAEIELAELAQSKSSNPKVKSLAHMLQVDHQQSNKKVQSLAASKNVTLPIDVPDAARETRTRLEQLTGIPFDDAYVDQVVKDHTVTIRDFEQASKIDDVDVKAFVEATLPTLKKHLQAAQGLQKAAPKGARN